MIPLKDSIASRRFPYVTAILLILNVCAFLFELSLDDTSLESFFKVFGLVPQLVTNPDLGFMERLTPFFSSQFLHGGWLHLIMNMWMLWIFADNVEDIFGSAGFLIFYLACGVGAGIAQVASGPDSLVPMIGASGAVSGVMGAYLRHYPHSRILTLVPIFFYPALLQIPASFFLVYWLGLQVLAGGVALVASQEGGIAWWAHIGGFGVGYALSFLRAKRKPQLKSFTRR